MEAAGAFWKPPPEEGVAFSHLCYRVLAMEAGFAKSCDINVVSLQLVCNQRCSSLGTRGVNGQSVRISVNFVNEKYDEKCSSTTFFP